MYQTYRENVTCFGKNLRFDNYMSKLAWKKTAREACPSPPSEDRKAKTDPDPRRFAKKKAGSDPNVQPPVWTPNNRTSKSRPRLTWALMHVVTGLLSTICPELRFGFNSKNAIWLFYVSVFLAVDANINILFRKNSKKYTFWINWKLFQSLT